MWRGLVVLLLLPAAAFGAEGYTLTYRGSNEWVAQEDAKPLRQLLKDAKARKATAFTFARSSADDEVRSTNRVLILRDILAKNIKGPIELREVMDSSVPAGSIVVQLP
jgi:hypothetical protein